MKWIFSVLILAIFSQEISAQNVTCKFANTNNIYTCTLTINNLQGFDNFTTIYGQHLAGKTNFDVRHVVSVGTVKTTVIPSIICESFRFTDVISITNSIVEEIGANSLRNCGVITSVNFANNQITKLAPNAFETNRFLKTILLEQNYLEELPIGLFRSSVSLQYLDMNYNYLYLIHSGVFGIHQNLKSIYLSNNFINALTPEIFNNTALTDFSFRNNLCGSGSWYSTPVLNITTALQRCLDNYEEYQLPSTTLPPPPPGKCGEGNIFDRVCEVEDKLDAQDVINKEFMRQIYELTEKVNELSSRPGAN
jgi:hypothetical protein